MSKIEKKHKWFTNWLYVMLGIAGLGVLLFLIGIIGTLIGLIIVGVVPFLLGGIIGFIFILYYWVDTRRTLQLYNIIAKGGLRSIPEIANKTGLNKLDVRQQVDKLIREGDLGEYMRVNDKVVLKSEYESEIDDAKNPGVAVKCQSCGSTYVKKNSADVCPYCGSVS